MDNHTLEDIIVDLMDGRNKWREIQAETGLSEDRCKELEQQIEEVFASVSDRRPYTFTETDERRCNVYLARTRHGAIRLVDSDGKPLPLVSLDIPNEKGYTTVVAHLEIQGWHRSALEQRNRS